MASPEYDYRSPLGGRSIAASLLSGGLLSPVRHKIFVSYHHRRDQDYYDAFSTAFHDKYDAVYDNSLERSVDSENPAYVLRRIRETCITGTSCTIVLVGAETYKRKYVDWEVEATLEKEHALIGVLLPTAPILANGRVNVPYRLNDNINSGFASWVHWNTVTTSAAALQQEIDAAKLKGKALITNSRARMTANLP